MFGSLLAKEQTDIPLKTKGRRVGRRGPDTMWRRPRTRDKRESDLTAGSCLLYTLVRPAHNPHIPARCFNIVGWALLKKKKNEDEKPHRRRQETERN